MVGSEKAKFDVIEDPWINIIDEENNKQVVGIREIFKNAYKYKEIYDNSLFYEYGIHRLLVVLLMDIYRPYDEFDLIDMLEGDLDINIFDNYIAECREEGNPFDIFDKDRPFLQSKFEGDTDKYIRPIETIILDMPSGNNAPIHYCGGHKELESYEVTYAESVKALCSIGPFSTSMSGGYPSSVNGTPPYYFIVKGKHLKETLLYNSVTESSILADYTNDLVPWKVKHEIVPKERIEVADLLQGMTIITRKIQLLENKGKVKEILISPGQNFVGYDSWRDPHTSLRKGKKGYITVKPREKESWKELGIAINNNEENRYRPITIQHLKKLNVEDKYSNIIIYGIETSQASYVRPIRETVVIPVEVLYDKSKNRCFINCIKWVEETEKFLISDIAYIDKTDMMYRIKEKLFTEILEEIHTSKELGSIYIKWRNYLKEEALEAYKGSVVSNLNSIPMLKMYAKEYKKLGELLDQSLGESNIEDKHIEDKHIEDKHIEDKHIEEIHEKDTYIAEELNKIKERYGEGKNSMFRNLRVIGTPGVDNKVKNLIHTEEIDSIFIHKLTGLIELLASYNLVPNIDSLEKDLIEWGHRDIKSKWILEYFSI